MRKLILFTVLALGLSACATFQNPLSPSRMDALNASWGTALSLANGYYQSCERRIIPQSCRTVVARMQVAVRPIHAKVLRARAFAKNPTISTIDLINVASDAVNDFKLLQSEMGVR